MPFIQANDIKIHYQQLGGGPNLVLIAGYSATISVWHRIKDELANSFRLLIFDNRGVGLSDCPDKEYTTEMMAQDTASLMDELNIDKAHILGHSMGGKIAQMFVLKHPQKTNKLMLVNTTYRLKSQTRYVENINMQLMEYQVPAELLIKNFAPWLYAHKFLNNKTEFNSEIKRRLKSITQQNKQGLANQMHAIVNHDITQQLKNITAEALVITGKEDILVSPSESEYLAKNIPNAKLEYLEECGHMPPIEAPQKLCQMLIDFISTTAKLSKETK